MFRRDSLHALLVFTICLCTTALRSQTGTKPLRQFRLPTPPTRGSYTHFPLPGLSARDHFAMRIAPDNSLLVFDSDTTGKWPLVRVRQWWTNHPVNDVLDIPGWSDADAKYMDAIHVDVKISPDGRYAVAFGEAVWKDKSSFLLHVPSGYVGRSPDTIITVINLEQWTILKSIHTSSMGSFYVRDANILNNKWIGFDGKAEGSPSDHGVYRYLDRLLSIPDLNPGPECTAQRFSHLWPTPPASLVDSTRTQNDVACRELMSATGTGSTEELEARIWRASDVEPTAIKLRDVRWKEDYLQKGSSPTRNDRQRIWDADAEADEFFRHWGEYPLYHLYLQNPPFESTSQLWYGLYSIGDRGLYELTRFDSSGQEQGSQVAEHLLCGDPSLGNRHSACGCRVVDVSEEERALLSYCRQQHGDFDGFFQHQWLAVFRSDDLSGVELIDLPKNGEALQALGVGEGEPYVLTLEFGETLSVYAIPNRK